MRQKENVIIRFISATISPTLAIFLCVILLLARFSHQLMVFHWNLFDSKSLHECRTLLSFLVYLNYLVVRIVSVRSPISNSFSPLTKPLRIVPRAPMTISMAFFFTFHGFFFSSSLVSSKDLSLFRFSLIFYSAVLRDDKVYYSTCFFLVNYHVIIIITIVLFSKT